MENYQPTTKQKALLETQDSALVVAGPGTGKTRTAIEKARHMLSSINAQMNRRVLFLSFSNAAIYRLLDSSNIHLGNLVRKRLRFLTYHAIAMEILRFYGRFVGLPSQIQVMDNLEEKLIFFEKEWEITGEEYQEKINWLAKGGGWISFSAMIPFACRLMETSPTLREIISREYPLIIVDEFQDTSAEQWQLLKLIGQDSQVVAFADPNQIIYSSLHKATTERINMFCEWKGVEVAEFSNRNFRCTRSEIISFAEALLRGTPFKKENTGDIILCPINYKSECRSALALIWKGIHKQLGKDESIAFLAPSNAIAEQVAVDLRNPPTLAKPAFPVYGRIAKDVAAHDAVLLALVALRDFVLSEGVHERKKAAIALVVMDLAWNTRKKMSISKVHTVDKIIEQAFRDGDDALHMVLETLKEASVLNAVLPSFIEALSQYGEFRSSCNRIAIHGYHSVDKVVTGGEQLLLFDEMRKQRQPKGLEGYSADKGRTQILTYHKAKGREFDYVIMIVDPRGESTQPPLEESRRLYYVCATRAKKGLVVIHRKNEMGRVLGPVLKPLKENEGSRE